MPQVLLKKLTMVSNQLKSSMSDDFCVWEATNFLYYLPPSVIVGVLLSVNDQVIERPATKTIPLVTPAKNTGARLAPGVVSKRLLFTLPNEYRGISWSLELDFTLHPLFISIEMICDGVHHKHSGFHFVRHEKEYRQSDYKSVDEGCSEVALVSPPKHSTLHGNIFGRHSWAKLLLCSWACWSPHRLIPLSLLLQSCTKPGLNSVWHSQM